MTNHAPKTPFLQYEISGQGLGVAPAKWGNFKISNSPNLKFIKIYF
ncbi:hypothetical protein [Campylobacter sp. JMF_04 NA10]|nr:hypothetical protein [Campylobacter sp. JMF_04 NA10]